MTNFKISDRLQGELVRFKTKDGLLLHGFLFRRNGRQAVIHIHGLGGNFYRSDLVWTLAKRYADIGYDLFSINTRGQDTIARIKTTDNRRKTIGTAYEVFEQCVYDIAAAIDAAEKWGYKKIVLQGHSTGCQKITYYQGKKQDKRVTSLVLIAPTDDLGLTRKRLGGKYKRAITLSKRLINKKRNELMPAWATHGFISANRFASYAIKGNAEADLFDYETGNFKLLKRIKTPIFATFGSAEEHRTSTSPDKALTIINEKAVSSPSVETALIKGADHLFKGKEKELADAIVGWLAKV